MAGEIQIDLGPSYAGITAYAMLRSVTGTVYNTASLAFEAFNASNIADYDIALTEQGASGYFTGNVPAAILATAIYATIKQRAGGSPAVSDNSIGGGELAAGLRAALGMAAADLDTQLDAIAARTDLIGTGEAVVVSPVASSGGIDIVIGSSYYDADSRALTWTDSGSAWPSLTGGSISLELWLPGASAAALTVAGTVVDANTARVELTIAQTATLSPRAYGMLLKATLSNTHVVVLVRDKARVTNATE